MTPNPENTIPTMTKAEVLAKIRAINEEMDEVAKQRAESNRRIMKALDELEANIGKLDQSTAERMAYLDSQKTDSERAQGVLDGTLVEQNPDPYAKTLLQMRGMMYIALGCLAVTVVAAVLRFLHIFGII